MQITEQLLQPQDPLKLRCDTNKQLLGVLGNADLSRPPAVIVAEYKAQAGTSASTKVTEKTVRGAIRYVGDLHLLGLPPDATFEQVDQALKQQRTSLSLSPISKPDEVLKALRVKQTEQERQAKMRAQEQAQRQRERRKQLQEQGRKESLGKQIGADLRKLDESLERFSKNCDRALPGYDAGRPIRDTLRRLDEEWQKVETREVSPAYKAERLAQSRRRAQILGFIDSTNAPIDEVYKFIQDYARDYYHIDPAGRDIVSLSDQIFDRLRRDCENLQIKDAKTISIEDIAKEVHAFRKEIGRANVEGGERGEISTLVVNARDEAGLAQLETTGLPTAVVDRLIALREEAERAGVDDAFNIDTTALVGKASAFTTELNTPLTKPKDVFIQVARVNKGTEAFALDAAASLKDRATTVGQILQEAKALGYSYDPDKPDGLAAKVKSDGSLAGADPDTTTYVEKLQAIKTVREKIREINIDGTDLVTLDREVRRLAGEAGLTVKGKTLPQLVDELKLVRDNIGYGLALGDISDVTTEELFGKAGEQEARTFVGVDEHAKPYDLARRLRLTRENAVEAKVANAKDAQIKDLDAMVDHTARIIGVTGNNAYLKAENLRKFRQLAVTAQIRDAATATNETLAAELDRQKPFLPTKLQGNTPSETLEGIKVVRDEAEAIGVADAWTTGDLHHVVSEVDKFRKFCADSHLTKGKITDLIAQLDHDLYIAELTRGSTALENAEALSKFWTTARDGLQPDVAVEDTPRLVGELRKNAHLVGKAPNEKPEVIAQEMQRVRTEARKLHLDQSDKGGFDQLEAIIRKDALAAGETRIDAPLNDCLAIIREVRTDAGLIGRTDATTAPVATLKDEVDRWRAQATQNGCTGTTTADLVASLKTQATYLQTNVPETGVTDVSRMTTTQQLEAVAQYREQGRIIELADYQTADLANIKNALDNLRNRAANEAGIAEATGASPLSIEELVIKIDEQAQEAMGYYGPRSRSAPADNAARVTAIRDFRALGASLGLTNPTIGDITSEIAFISEAGKRLKTPETTRPNPNVTQIATEIRTQAQTAGIANWDTIPLREAIALLEGRTVQINVDSAHIRETATGVFEMTPVGINWREGVNQQALMHNLVGILGGDVIIDQAGTSRTVHIVGLLKREEDRINPLLATQPALQAQLDLIRDIRTYLDGIRTRGELPRLSGLLQSGNFDSDPAIPAGLRNTLKKLWRGATNLPGGTRFKRDVFKEEQRYLYDMVDLLAGTATNYTVVK